MNDKITEIRARHERIQRDCTLATPPVSMAGQVAAVDAHEDRATLLDLAEQLRAENDELYRAAGRTRAALSGWVLASPDREDEPTHALVAAVVAEVERLRADLDRLRYREARVERRITGPDTPVVFIVEGNL